MNKWYNKLQYGAMLAMAAAMPVSWHVGLCAAMALAAVSIVKMVAQRKVGNPALDWKLSIPFYAVIVYWLLIVISVFYSADLAAALNVVKLKSVLLIFPLSFLLSDTSYLEGKHIRGLGYSLLLSVCAVFLFFTGKAIVSMIGGSTFEAVTGSCTFDPRHHAYTSFYMAVAIVFVLHELSRRWNDMKGWHKVLLALSLLICMTYLMIVNSRAGILTLWIVLVSYALYMWLYCKQWKPALLAVCLFAVVQVGMKLTLPKHDNRVVATVESVSAGDEDARMKIYKSAVHVAVDNPVVGFGSGDYYQRFAEVSDVENDGYVAKNAHNQYLETLLSIGIVGLVPFMIWLLSPIWLAWRRKSQYFFLVLVLVGTVMFNFLFESMLERQMGLLFAGFVMAITVLVVSLEENKFGQTPKK